MICYFPAGMAKSARHIGSPRSSAQTMAALKIKGVTLHSLRHTHASQLIASGMDPLTISRRLSDYPDGIWPPVWKHGREGGGDYGDDVLRSANGVSTGGIFRWQSGGNLQGSMQEIQ